MKKYFSEIRAISRPLLGIFFSQVFAMLLSTTDILIAGSISHIDLAGVSVATSIYIPIMLFFAGLLMVSPIISFKLGANDFAGARATLRHSMIMSLVFATLAILTTLIVGKLILNHLDLEPEVYTIAKQCLFLFAMTLPASMVYFVVRAIFESTFDSNPIFISSTIVFFANILFNFIFAKGWLGFPALGGVGCALSTLANHYIWVSILVYFYLKNEKINKLEIFSLSGFGFDFKECANILKMSTPFALGIFFEASFFNATILLASSFGTEAMAGHQIILNMGSIMFMIPLSIGIVVANRMSFKIGAKKYIDLKRTMISTYIMMLAFFAVVFVVVSVFGEDFVMLYNKNEKVLAIALMLLPMLLINFFFDCLQNVSAAIVRGFGKTHHILWIAFFIYMILGMILSFVFSRFTENIVGIWWGMIVAFAIAFVILLLLNIKFYRKIKLLNIKI